MTKKDWSEIPIAEPIQAKKEKEMKRQGDVLIFSAAIPPDAKRIKLEPLALGEVTGHSHAVAEPDVERVEMYELDGKRFLRVTGEGLISIVHEEHGPQTLSPGDYEVRIQVEEGPDEVIRQVAD